MKVLAINNINNNYRNSKMNVHINNANSMNSKVSKNATNVSFGGVFSTMQTSKCMDAAKKSFASGFDISGIKSFTEGMKILFSKKGAVVDTLTSLFSKKQDMLMATAAATMLKLNDESKENQEVKKDFMYTMLIQGSKNSRNSVDNCVVDAFSKMDNDVYGAYKNLLLKSSFEKGNYYDADTLENILKGVDMSDEDKNSLKNLNTSRLYREEVEYYENSEPYIPQDPRYTP